MSFILESVEWGKSALSLLSQCKELDPDLPSVMHIRHSERFTSQSEEALQKPLTELGKKAALEFGFNLAKGRTYRLYHNYVNRTKETAEQIRRGISDNGGTSQIMDLIDLSFMLDVEKALNYFETDARVDRSLNKSHTFFFRWVSGRYPPEELKPSLEFAQQGATLMMENLQSAGSDTMDIYISHDGWVAAFLLHWFGITPLDWIGFLDGFIVQFTNKKAIVYYKDERLDVVLPYWWGFTS